MKNAMIVAPEPEAAEAGIEVLGRGGNAIDAALVCALVQGVVNPQMASLGGFGSMQIYMPSKGVHEVLEFYSQAPLAARADMWADKLVGQYQDGFGFILEGDISELGYQAICTPAAVAGYAEALKRYGTYDWVDIFGPAIQHAERGFMVRPHVHFYWTEPDVRIKVRDRLALTATGRSIYFNTDGSLKQIGEIIHNPGLTTTLKRLVAGGPECFYTGEIAEEIAADFKANGGLLTMEDLAACKVSVTEPIWGEYRGHLISSNPPPSSGFPMLELLHILESFDISAMEHGGFDHVLLLSEAMKRMTIDKERNMGDPLFVEVPHEQLISKAHCADLAASIRRGERAVVDRLDDRQRDTTHVTVVDREGNIALLTHSLGAPSGVITEGLGFMYNGLMSRFDPRPGRPASIAPGKRRPSSAAHAIVFKDGAPHIAIGAPGGSYIAPSVAQGIMNVIDFDMPIFDAVSAPRVVAVSNAIEVCNRIRRSVTDRLEAEKFKVKRSSRSHDFALLHAVKIDAGVCTGGADPRGDGCAYST